MSRATERQKAVALKAADASDLIRTSLPFLFQRMTAGQVDQVQRVLDAKVVNPAIEKEAAEFDRKSIAQRSGSLVVYDKAMVHRAATARRNKIQVTDADKRVRLDLARLLTPDALQTTTDNADEAAYLNKVRLTLMNRGVWLRVDLKMFAPDPTEPSRRIFDDRTFQVWLSLGPEGEPIPTDTGRLTRAALMGNQTLGAGYFREVFQGNVQTVLEKALLKVEMEIVSGEDLHGQTARDRRDTTFGVVEISDGLGGADFPDQIIWKGPRDLLLQALKMNVGGDVKDSSRITILAALMAGFAAQTLADYIQATNAGAARAVKVLTVVKRVGQIAEAVLLVHTVATGLVRILATNATASGGGAINTLAKTNVNSPAALANTGRMSDTMRQASVAIETERGVVLGVDASNVERLRRIRGFNAELDAYRALHPNASLAERMRAQERAIANWGDPLDYLP